MGEDDVEGQNLTRVNKAVSWFGIDGEKVEAEVIEEAAPGLAG
jgi:hypothetical protein